MAGHRISILSLHYPPDATGVAPYAGALAAGLSARGRNVSARVAHPFYPEWKIRTGYGQWRRTETIDAVTVHRLRHYVPRPPRGVRRLVSELSLGIRFACGRFDQDSVVIAISPALFATAMAALRIRLTRNRPSLIVWVQDLYTLGMVETKEGGGLSTRVTKLVERLVLCNAERVVVIHPRFAAYVADELKVDPARIEVIRNWTHLLPSPLVSQQEGRTALGWPTDVVLAVHTGNMGAKQGLENVVEAARLADRRHSPIVFVLVGDGGERQRLEHLAKGVERIKFVDPLGESDYRSALAAANCLLVNELPGVSSMAVPSKLTSYFDAARPIVAATDRGGITAGEIELASAGVVVPAGDPEALLEAVLELSRDPDRALGYATAGRRFRTETLEAGGALSAFDRLVTDVASEQESCATTPDAEGASRWGLRIAMRRRIAIRKSQQETVLGAKG
jgi:glycosyltransferase involved in cell wall biosynthesis